MKQLLCLSLTVLVFIYVHGQNGQMFTDKIDERFGFRDIKLETGISQLKNKQLVKIEDAGSTKYYKSKIENLKLGDYFLKSIVYVFYKDELMEVTIKTKGLNNCAGLLNILKQSYGNGFKGNEHIEQYLWKSDKVTIFYDQNSIVNDATLTISSKKLDDLSKTEQDEKNKKTSKSDF